MTPKKNVQKISYREQNSLWQRCRIVCLVVSVIMMWAVQIGTTIASTVVTPPTSGYTTDFPRETDKRPRSGPKISPFTAGYGQNQMGFEPNIGQTDQSVQFMARGEGYTVFLTNTEAVLVFPAELPSLEAEATTTNGPAPTVGLNNTLRLQILEANPTAAISGMEETPTTINRMIGQDKTQWHSNVPVYRKVQYQEMYPGIDLVYYGNQHRLEYDFVIHPGAEPSVIKMGIQGSDQATLDDEGNLLLSMKGGTLRLQKPALSQTVAGTNTAIQGGFALLKPEATDPKPGTIQIAFEVGSYDPTLPLIIDPIINYASYIGGEGQDIGEAIAIDNAGHGYLVGTTDSFTFPVTPNAFQQSAISTDRDIFVTKFDTETSDIIFSTYIGGEGDDLATGVALDPEGSPYITGQTNSLTFPTQNPLQESLQGESDAFVLKLAQDGSTLLYSTYVGGTNMDTAHGIAVDQVGQAYITGETASVDFPTENPFDVILGDGREDPQSDAFVTKLGPQGSSLLFSTFLGGSANDVGHSIARDQEGGIYITGETAKLPVTPGSSVSSPSSPFPITPGAFQATFGGGATDAFIAKLSSTLAGEAALLYSSYLGGNGEDVGLDLFVDQEKQVYLTGRTTSESGFPLTADAFDPIFNGGQDAFLAKVDVEGVGQDALAYATYVGGSQHDVGVAIGKDTLGRPCITGTTTSADFPLENPLEGQGALKGGTDIFLAKFQADDSTLLFSSFLGGSADDVVTDMSLDPDNFAYLTGHTRSRDFPLHNSEMPLVNDQPDAFLVKIQDPVDLLMDLFPEGYAQLGVDQVWRLAWSNFGPDLATGVTLNLAFDPQEEFGPSSKIQFKSIKSGTGPSDIDISSCSGTAQNGSGGFLSCDVTDVPVNTGASTDFSEAFITFTPIAEGTFDITASIFSAEEDTNPGITSDTETGEIGNTVSLAIDFAGTGTGMTSADPPQDDGGFICFNDCELSYALEESPISVTLTPTPTIPSGGQLSIFAGWSGCNSFVGNQCIVVMNSDQAVVATFEPPPGDQDQDRRWVYAERRRLQRQ